jgi:hypothetical protein
MRTYEELQDEIIASNKARILLHKQNELLGNALLQIMSDVLLTVRKGREVYSGYADSVVPLTGDTDVQDNREESSEL